MKQLLLTLIITLTSFGTWAQEQTPENIIMDIENYTIEGEDYTKWAVDRDLNMVLTTLENNEKTVTVFTSGNTEEHSIGEIKHINTVLDTDEAGILLINGQWHYKNSYDDETGVVRIIIFLSLNARTFQVEMYPMGEDTKVVEASGIFEFSN